VDPSIGYTSEDNLIRDVEIHNEIEWGAMFSKPSSEMRREMEEDKVTLT
jgi:hypothetical protein